MRFGMMVLGLACLETFIEKIADFFVYCEEEWVLWGFFGDKRLAPLMLYLPGGGTDYEIQQKFNDGIDWARVDRGSHRCRC